MLKRLTQEQIERLVTLYIAGASLRRVAKAVGTNHNNVKYHLKRAGVKVRSFGDYFDVKPLTKRRKAKADV